MYYSSFRIAFKHTREGVICSTVRLSPSGGRPNSFIEQCIGNSNNRRKKLQRIVTVTNRRKYSSLKPQKNDLIN